ncbi:hypothetical protein Tco_0358383, partial [Tanacetum coccineum]
EQDPQVGNHGLDQHDQRTDDEVKFIESYEIDRKIEELVKEVVSSSVKHAMAETL